MHRSKFACGKTRLLPMQGVCDGPIIESAGESDTTSANDWAYYKVRRIACETGYCWAAHIA